MMSKHSYSIRMAVCSLSLLVFLLGCQDETDKPEKKTQVVSQKISIGTQNVKPQAPEKVTPSPIAAPTQPTAETTGQEGATGTMATAMTSGETYDTEKLIPDMTMGYDPVGRIDPFIPLIRDEPVKVEKKKLIEAKGEVREVRTKTPLEKIELSQLRLRAIIMAPSGNRALVEESSGKGYIITKGTYIGRNDGKVTKILKDTVVVEEMVEDIEGKMVIEEKEIKLPKPPGEE